MIRGSKRRPRAERNRELPGNKAVMAEKNARLAEAQKELEEAEKLRRTAAVQENTCICAAEIDEETQTLTTVNFRPSQVGSH
jgi:hypothetical protein